MAARGSADNFLGVTVHVIVTVHVMVTTGVWGL